MVEIEVMFTLDTISEAWKHQMPKKFFYEFMNEYLKEKEILDNFEDIELSVIAEYLLYNLIFIKEELNVNENIQVDLLNIAIELLTLNNKKFKKSGEKTLELDYEHLKKLLEKLYIEEKLDLLSIEKTMAFIKE